ncbi:MAG: DUF3604 domain-containing protein [Deltaproteobacteria bacterium]|nr:DUF3604 domain-containing protein [Deltaproteobacteria bacterium]
MWIYCAPRLRAQCPILEAADVEELRCPDNGASADITSSETPGETGAGELMAAWQDHDFDASQGAFYYVRAIQNPTCRWSTYDAIRLGIAHVARRGALCLSCAPAVKVCHAFSGSPPNRTELAHGKADGHRHHDPPLSTGISKRSMSSPSKTQGIVVSAAPRPTAQHASRMCWTQG